MKKRLGYVLLFVIAGFLNAHTQENYHKVSQVKVYLPSDIHQRNVAIGLLDLDHFYEEDGAIISEFNEQTLNKLKAANIRYEVLIDDMMLHLKELNDQYYAAQKAAKKGGDAPLRVAIEQPGSVIDNIIVRPATFEVKTTFGGYYSFAEMEAAMNALVAANPGIASKTSIGTTAGGRNIWVIKISDNVANDETNEPEVLYMGLQHAREAITGASMIFFMQYLCEQYKSTTDARIKNLVDNREFYIIPCFNPDGWEHNRTAYGLNTVGGDWRKNRKNNGNGTIGVDLNRNWGVDWGNCPGLLTDPNNACGTSVSGEDTYIGPSAFSELETQAVRNFTKSRHIVAGFDQHAYGPYYSLPFGRKGLHTMSQKGTNFYTAVPALMGKYNGMRAADSYDALGYEVAGGFKDWMLMGELGATFGATGGLKDTVWAMTGEGAAGGGTVNTNTNTLGTRNFWAPAGEIVNLCKGMCYQNLQLAYAAGTYVDVQDADDIALTSATGTLNVSVKRLGLGNDPVTITLVPIENVKTVGPPVTINSMTYYETITKGINYTLGSGISNGLRVRYAWKVSMGGYSYSDTVVKFYNPTQLFFDNMEGTLTTNWLNTASTGSLVSGFGYNYTAGSWVFTTSGGYNSTKALSESAAGTNYTTRSIRTLQCNTVFNLLDATAAYLTFWTRHKAENFRDKMQVQVSTNGGTTWTPITGRTSIKEPGILDGSTINGQSSLTGVRDYWTQEVFDLSAYNGQAALRLRFLFTSDNDPATTFLYRLDDGFYIDNVRVIKSTAALITLPANILTFSGQLQPDKTVHLKWTAELGEQHDYFEVQRADDGNEFTVIGKVDQLYEYKDMTPNAGTNLYRIRQVDKDGKGTYSKVVNIAVTNNVEVTAYPNPVRNKLFIKTHSRHTETFEIRITDISGRTVYSSRQNGAAAAGLTVDMNQWPAQTYVLKVINRNNDVLATHKVVKL